MCPFTVDTVTHRIDTENVPSQRPVEGIKKDRVVKPPVQRYAQCSVCCDHLQEDPEQKGVFYCTQCWEIWKAQRHCTTTPPQHQHQRPFPPPFPPTPLHTHPAPSPRPWWVGGWGRGRGKTGGGQVWSVSGSERGRAWVGGGSVRDGV